MIWVFDPSRSITISIRANLASATVDSNASFSGLVLPVQVSLGFYLVTTEVLQQAYDPFGVENIRVTTVRNGSVMEALVAFWWFCDAKLAREALTTMVRWLLLIEH